MLSVITYKGSKQMTVSNNITEIQALMKKIRKEGKTIGIVPTMGALHNGHMSLIKKAKEKCDFVFVSIFLNPIQFAPGEDLDKYPRTLQADLEKCEANGADLVFTPTNDIMYPEGFASKAEVMNISRVLEGAIRPIHFAGVCTVCLKLFNISMADYGFFGQKDFQQVAVLKKMTRELNVPIELVMCPIIRDTDNLAMSSRNSYLSPEERQRALFINKGLFAAKEAFDKGEKNVDTLRKILTDTIMKGQPEHVDYIDIYDADTLEKTDTTDNAVMLIACKFGTTRLIDNMLL